LRVLALASSLTFGFWPRLQHCEYRNSLLNLPRCQLDRLQPIISNLQLELFNSWEVSELSGVTLSVLRQGSQTNNSKTFCFVTMKLVRVGLRWHRAAMDALCWELGIRMHGVPSPRCKASLLTKGFGTVRYIARGNPAPIIFVHYLSRNKFGLELEVYM